MNEYTEVDAENSIAVPDGLKALFNDAGEVRVQKLPCLLPGLESKAVFFNAGARTVPHKHEGGQHIVITSGTGVFGDDDGIHIVKQGDVISNAPTGWHWHGALPGESMPHLTVEAPGLDLSVEQRDWEQVYTDDLGR
jgi:quercetin dioxygenase-like cupin family protein